MIRPRAKAARSSATKHPYKGSSRSIPPLNRRSKSGTSRSKWNIIKAVLLIGGVSIIYGCVYSFEEQEDQAPQQPHTANIQGAVSAQGSDAAPVVPDSSGDRFLSRGLSGLPMDQTPALLGASRGHIECDVNVDELVYWNDPQGERDRNFKSPFAKPSSSGKTKYITFEPDRGGWNNIRMNLENIFVFAAATGRTLVLPPAAPLYLMNHDKKEKHKGFGDFFPLNTDEFQKRVPIITMEEFLKTEGALDGQFPIPEDSYEDVIKSGQECDNRAKSDISCDHVFDYLESSGFVPQFNSSTCLVFAEDMFESGQISDENEAKVKEFCSPRDEGIFYVTGGFEDEQLVHFKNSKGWRIMSHFYGYMYFTNSEIFNYYKRFVRDFLHYHDEIYCAAGKIVLALQEDGRKLGFALDKEGGGGYASLHVRRGDLQYKKVKIPAEEWNDNLQDTWQPNEIIYIATDERNKTFFDPIAQHHTVKFLDDYWDYAGLANLDGNYMGMIDTIVASRGRTFGGTFFSTFTGYINRMRGYHGMSMNDSYYGYLPKKDILHEFKEHYSGTTFSYEWPLGWIGIDGDKEQSRDKY